MVFAKLAVLCTAQKRRRTTPRSQRKKQLPSTDGLVWTQSKSSMKPRPVSRGNRARPSSGDMGPAQRRQDDGSSPTRGAEEERDDGLTVEEDALLQLLMKKNRMKTNAGGGRSVASLGGERRSKGGRSRSSASVISNPATRFELQASGSRKQSKVNKTKKNEMPMNGAEMEYLVALMKQEEERKEEAELLRSIERARELERRRAATFMPKDDLSTVESEASESKSKSKTTIDDTLYDAMESALSCVGEWTEGSYTSGEESEMSSESEDDDEDEVSYKLSKTEPVILNMSSATKMPKPTQAQNRGRSSASMTLDLPSSPGPGPGPGPVPTIRRSKFNPTGRGQDPEGRRVLEEPHVQEPQPLAQVGLEAKALEILEQTHQPQPLGNAHEDYVHPTENKQDADKSGETFEKDEKKPEENAEEEKSKSDEEVSIKDDTKAKLGSFRGKLSSPKLLKKSTKKVDSTPEADDEDKR
ncbi:hypothetical protein THAOC_06152, partial [Thalassiosira oceanica]